MRPGKLPLALLFALGPVGPAAVAAHEATPVGIARLDPRLARHPGDGEAWLTRAALARATGDLETAASALARAAACVPAPAGVPLERAAQGIARDRPDEALTALEPVEESAVALRLRARALEGLGRFADAAVTLAAAAERATPSTEETLWRAGLIVRAGAPQDALALLDASFQRTPAPPLAQRAAALELSLGRPAAAEARLDRLAAMLGAPQLAARAAATPPARARVAGTAAVTTLVPVGATWRWHAQGVDLGTAWRASAFVDDAWAQGPAPLGYGEGWIATVLPWGPDASNKHRTTYFRIHFTPAVAPGELASLRLAVNYDDGFVAYLNGVEIARRAMPAGAPTHATLAGNHEAGVFETVDVSASLPLLASGDNVLAVELHQSSAASSDLVWDAALIGDAAASVTRGPYLQMGAPDAVTVRWRTGIANVGVVRYGPAGLPATSAATEAAATTEHEVRLTPLEPATAYAYFVGTAAETLAGDSTFRFRTPPPAGVEAPVRLWIVGDSGTGGNSARAVRDAFAAWQPWRPADLWLMLGDNAYGSGTDAEYQAAVFDMYPAMLSSTVLWPTRGNHDGVYAGAGNDYYDHFTLPTAGESGGVPSGSEAWYAFDWGPVHFVCLDSEGTSRAPGGAMLQWLVADLAATTQPWIVAFWHHPPYTKGSHDSDDPADSGGRMRDMRENALPILEAAGVDLVLAGHSHSYERSFLLDQHYGVSGTLHDSMAVDAGDGRFGGAGAYFKPTPVHGAHEGTVYAVAGSSGQIGGGTLDHPVMITSLNVLGSMVVDVDGARLDARFLSSTGAVLDSFTVIKGESVGVRPPRLSPLSVGPALPTPFRDLTRVTFALPVQGRARLRIVDVAGREVRTLLDGPRAAGPQDAWWDGYDDLGRRVGAGVYFAVLEADGGIAARRLVKVN